MRFSPALALMPVSSEMPRRRRHVQIETVEKVGVIIIFWIVLAFAGTILVRLAIGIPWLGIPLLILAIVALLVFIALSWIIAGFTGDADEN
jgi:hypothetical protein